MFRLLWPSCQRGECGCDGFRLQLHALASIIRPKKVSTSLHASVHYKDMDHLLQEYRQEPILLAFTALNCGPCQLQRRELQTVQQHLSLLQQQPPQSPTAASYRNKNKLLTMLTIDTDKWPHVGSRFRVGKLPCLVVVQDGTELLRLEGFQTADEIAERVGTLLLEKQREH